MAKLTGTKLALMVALLLVGFIVALTELTGKEQAAGKEGKFLGGKVSDGSESASAAGAASGDSWGKAASSAAGDALEGDKSAGKKKKSGWQGPGKPADGIKAAGKAAGKAADSVKAAGQAAGKAGKQLADSLKKLQQGPFGKKGPGVPKPFPPKQGKPTPKPGSPKRSQASGKAPPPTTVQPKNHKLSKEQERRQARRMNKDSKAAPPPGTEQKPAAGAKPTPKPKGAPPPFKNPFAPKQGEKPTKGEKPNRRDKAKPSRAGPSADQLKRQEHKRKAEAQKRAHGFADLSKMGSNAKKNNWGKPPGGKPAHGGSGKPPPRGPYGGKPPPGRPDFSQAAKDFQAKQYKLLDINNDGVVTLEEAKEAVLKLKAKAEIAGNDLSDKKRRGHMKGMDSVESNLLQKTVVDKAGVEGWFKHMDRDGDGKLLLSELQRPGKPRNSMEL